MVLTFLEPFSIRDLSHRLPTGLLSFRRDRFSFEPVTSGAKARDFVVLRGTTEVVP
jgi:hypothetical protein